MSRDPGPPVVLVLAGHDPSGGAGVDADAEAIRAAGALPVTVVTADTDQDAGGLRAVRARPAREVEAAALAALDGGRVAALKFGLLPDAACIAAAARVLEQAHAVGVERCVLDPVLAPSRGPRFHGPEGVRELLERLGPLGCVWTPNVPELAALTLAEPGLLARAPAEREAAARRLLASGARAVVATGGHGTEDPLVDLCVTVAPEALRLERPRLPGPGIRGSGCRFAAHLAAGLALGRRLPEAAAAAGDYLARCIAAASRDGPGANAR